MDNAISLSIGGFFEELRGSGLTVWGWMDEHPECYIRWYETGGFAFQPLWPEDGYRLFIKHLEDIDNAGEEKRSQYGKSRVKAEDTSVPTQQRHEGGAAQSQSRFEL